MIYGYFRDFDSCWQLCQLLTAAITLPYCVFQLFINFLFAFSSCICMYFGVICHFPKLAAQQQQQEHVTKLVIEQALCVLLIKIIPYKECSPKIIFKSWDFDWTSYTVGWPNFQFIFILLAPPTLKSLSCVENGILKITGVPVPFKRDPKPFQF